MTLTESEINILRNDGAFENVDVMNRLNNEIERLFNARQINITYDDIKKMTQSYINENYPNKLIEQLTNDEKMDVAESVINDIGSMQFEGRILQPAHNNWTGNGGKKKTKTQKRRTIKRKRRTIKRKEIKRKRTKRYKK